MRGVVRRPQRSSTPRRRASHHTPWGGGPILRIALGTCASCAEVPQPYDSGSGGIFVVESVEVAWEIPKADCAGCRPTRQGVLDYLRRIARPFAPVGSEVTSASDHMVMGRRASSLHVWNSVALSLIEDTGELVAPVDAPIRWSHGSLGIRLGRTDLVDASITQGPAGAFSLSTRWSVRLNFEDPLGISGSDLVAAGWQGEPALADLRVRIAYAPRP